MSATCALCASPQPAARAPRLFLAIHSNESVACVAKPQAKRVLESGGAVCRISLTLTMGCFTTSRLAHCTPLKPNTFFASQQHSISVSAADTLTADMLTEETTMVRTNTYPVVVTTGVYVPGMLLPYGSMVHYSY